MFTFQVYTRAIIRRAILARTAQKQLRRVPRHVAVKLQAWLEMVESQGIEETRKIPGFHDEPLAGPRQGQRSIRLSQAYRAIYEVTSDSEGQLARVKEVTHHEY